MKLAAAVTAVLLVVYPLGAQQQPLAAISGYVTAAAGGEPLANARVMVEEEQPGRHEYVTVSDSTGFFAVTGIEPGRYSLLGDKDGYYRPARNGGNQLITLNEGESEGVAIRLAVTGTISGRVLNENREPMSDVRVEALQQVYTGGGRALLPVGRPAQTDDNGAYRLYWLMPGKYLVRATYIRKNPAAADDSEGYAPAYYPASMDRSATLPLTVSEGEEVSAIDLTMLPGSALHLRGSVVNTVAAEPSSVSEFYLVPRDPNDVPYGRSFLNVTPKTDSFELRGVESGRFYLYPLLTYKGVTYSGRMPVDIADSDIDGAKVIITSGENLAVHIHYDDGTGSDTRLDGIEVRLIPANGTPDELTPKPLIINNEGNQTDTISNVAMGDYTLSVSPLPAGTYVQSARLDDHDIEGGPAATANPDGQGLLDIVLNGNGGTVGGRVSGTDDTPLSNASLVLAPADPKQRGSAAAFKTTVSDQNGAFSIQGVAPGDYKLFAWDGMENGAYLDPGFLAPFETGATAVHVDPSGVTNVQIHTLSGVNAGGGIHRVRSWYR